MRTTARIAAIESIIVSLPRDVPYLGPFGPGEAVNAQGYFVRKGNRTLYPSTDMSVLVKATAEDGTIGWGETYGIVAPEAVAHIIDDVLGPIVVGRDPRDAAVIQEDLYDLMRVRGYFGGFYVDAIAGIDIAIWDLFGRIVDQPLVKLLGGQRQAKIPAYVSGLPRATLPERVDLARDFHSAGYTAFKYAAAVSHEGIVEEMRALRDTLGPDVELMVDLHWKFTGHEAMQLIDRLAQFRPYFVEAPCAPEDLEGQAQVSASSRIPIALGEELRTIYEYRPRFERRAMSIIQPEMGHTGVTQFMQIARMANAFHVRTIPHASIGVGIFQAASLHASAALPNVPMHEYQHSVFDRNLRYVDTSMSCRAGAFAVPEGPGLGVTPRDELWQFIRSKSH